MQVIIFPLLHVRLFSWPDTIKLTDKEAEAMRLYHLGGVRAWRTETGQVARNTIEYLFKKGLLDRNGATPMGKEVAKACADAAHEDATQQPEDK